MIFTSVLARFGLLSVLVGSGIEGEPVAVTAGVLVQQGYLPFIPTAICTALGAFVIDQFWFHAARQMRERPLVRRLTRRRVYQKAMAALERHQIGFILAFRFLYGTRSVSPVAIGTSNVSSQRFLALNLIAAAVWGPVFTAIGFEFGQTAFPMIRKFAPVLAVAAAVISLLVIAVVGLKARSSDSDP